VTEDRPWLGEEPTGRPDTNFSPGPTGFAVFLGVAAPIVFVGVARAGGTNVLIVVIGLVVGVIAGVAVAAWIDARGGRGPKTPL
jgi:hypothetical protein